MHIWKPGDIARVTRDVVATKHPWLERYAGEEVTLMHFSGVLADSFHLDWWHVRHGDGHAFFVREVALRRRDDPDEFERGSWSEIQSLTGWHPVKELIS